MMETSERSHSPLSTDFQKSKLGPNQSSKYSHYTLHFFILSMDKTATRLSHSQGMGKHILLTDS